MGYPSAPVVELNLKGFIPLPPPPPLPPPVQVIVVHDDHKTTDIKSGVATVTTYGVGDVVIGEKGTDVTVYAANPDIITLDKGGVTAFGGGNKITVNIGNVVDNGGGGPNGEHVTVNTGNITGTGDHIFATVGKGLVSLTGNNNDVTLGAGSSLNSHGNNVTAHVGIGDVDPLNFFGGTGEKVVFSGAVNSQHDQRGFFSFFDNFHFGKPTVEVVQGFQNGVLDFSQLTHAHGQVLEVTETVQGGNLFVHLFSADDHHDHHDHHQADFGFGSLSSNDGFTVELVGVTHTTVVGATVVQDHSHVWFG